MEDREVKYFFITPEKKMLCDLEFSVQSCRYSYRKSHNLEPSPSVPPHFNIKIESLNKGQQLNKVTIVKVQS